MINKGFDNIEIPGNIDDIIDLSIDKIRKEKLIMKKKKQKIVGTVAATLVVAITIGVSNPVIAENIPILRDVFKILQNNHQDTSIVPNLKYSDHSTLVGITKESNGVKITMQEIVYDGEGIYISYKIESEKPFGYKTVSSPVNYDIDPVEGIAIINEDTEYETKELTSMWIEQKKTVDYSDIQLESYDWLDGMIVDDNTFIGVICYAVPESEDGTNPKEFKASINIEEIAFTSKIEDWNNMNIEGNEKFSVKGNWDFNFDVKLNDSMEEEIIEVNEIKEGFKLEKIIKTPFSIKAKIVPLKEENQKNILVTGSTAPQLQQCRIIGSENTDYGYGYGMPTSNESQLIEGDVPGTMYVGIDRSINNKAEFFEIEVEDNTILGQPCIDLCENPEHHANWKHPKVFKFDTKIYNK